MYTAYTIPFVGAYLSQELVSQAMKARNAVATKPPAPLNTV
jgi:hypothetical protein